MRLKTNPLVRQANGAANCADGAGTLLAEHGGAEFAGVAAGGRRGGGDVLPGVIAAAVGEREQRVAGAVGRHADRAEIKLALAVAAEVLGEVAIDINEKTAVGRAVQFPLNDGAGAVAEGVGDDGEILQIVRAGVAIANVVRDHVEIAEIDAEIAVAENGIAADGIVRRAGIIQDHAGTAGKGDHVARARAVPPMTLPVAPPRRPTLAKPLASALVPVMSVPMRLP